MNEDEIEQKMAEWKDDILSSLLGFPVHLPTQGEVHAKRHGTKFVREVGSLERLGIEFDAAISRLAAARNP